MIKPENKDSSLRWSHYADEHRGVCITYKIPQSFLTGKIIGCVNVNYHPEPLIEYLNTCTLQLEEFIREFSRIYLKTKSPAWEYEQEARIILKEHGVLPIPGEFIKEICFGLRTAERDIELITTLAKDYCGCSNFKQITRTESSFGFTASKID